LADNERGSAVGTVSSFFDMSQGLGALLLGIVAALSGYRGAFVGGAVLSLGAFVVLRTGARARAREPVDHAAAAYARTVVEPEVP
jgi:predicted MFS family arabinose efflux permease